MEEPNREKRYRNRMQRRREVVDKAIIRANQAKGLLLVLAGKGKPGLAFGMVARILDHGMKAGVAQFIKGHSDTGEEALFRQQSGVVWHVLDEGFSWETQNLVRDTETANKGWAVVREILQDPSLNLAVLDELTCPLKLGGLDLATVLTVLRSHHPCNI